MTTTLIVAGSHVDITVEDEKNSIPQADLIAWVKMAAESVAGYYGRYPVPHLTLRITPFSGHGVRHGMTWGIHGGLIKIGLGSETTRAFTFSAARLSRASRHSETSLPVAIRITCGLPSASAST